MQEFSVPKVYGTILKLCAFCFLCFVIFGLVMPFLPPIGHSEPDQGAYSTVTNAAVSIALIVAFGLAALLAWREGSRMSRETFVTDEDGIWPKDVGRAQGLVPWSAIASIKERSQFQRLDLFDSKGRRLLIIDYQINNFSTLAQIIYDKTYQSIQLPSKRKFTMGVFYHILYMIVIVAISCFFFALLHYFYPPLEYVASIPIALIFIWAYIKQPFGVSIDHQRLVLIHPIGKKVIPFSDISKMEVRDLLKNSGTGTHMPGILLTLNSASKRIVLNSIGVPNIVLYAILRNALEQNNR